MSWSPFLPTCAQQYRHSGPKHEDSTQHLLDWQHGRQLELSDIYDI